FLASSTALRSSALSRQVGAAILSPTGEVLSVGTNEVPCFGGGQYWGEKDSPDARDHIKGRDSTNQMEVVVLKEILEILDPDWSNLPGKQQGEKIAEFSEKLKSTRVMNLTEFGRAVHAEMEAIIAAARVGISIRGATLYTTTFPCHGCAKHIVGAGIKRVVYVEPYPKSLAIDLHDDSIALDSDRAEKLQTKVNFEPFVGVSPRRYNDLFSDTTKQGIRIRRKDSSGKLIDSRPGLRLSMSPYNYVQRERFAAKEAAQLFETGGKP
ncbi:MAG: cytidine deaminase, partial [Acidobacteria bacterium]|nr:cytidine deaminase [Acidobacteriota bacterium]